MVIEAITSFIIEQALVILPRFLASRVTSSEKIASQIEIDLRRVNPIDISFGRDIPRIDLYFRISNLSPINLVLDRLLIDLWVRQPTFRGAILERYEVPKRSSREDIHFIYHLTTAQQEQIRRQVNGQLLSVPITIYVKGYFDSKVGLVQVEKRLEHGNIPCPLPAQ
jgi:hypothetical protein